MCNVYSKDDLTCFYWSATEFTYIIPIHDPYILMPMESKHNLSCTRRNIITASCFIPGGKVH